MARSITDQEIALIKRMLAKGMRNVDIQFYFNRPDRPANSGRISQIRGGTYGPEVPEATEEELTAFLSGFKPAEVGVVVTGEERPLTLAEQAAKSFTQNGAGEWFLRGEESSTFECKREFNPKKMAPIIRAIAALANNKGGFIFVGVEDDEGRVVGLQDNAFVETDIVRITENVKKHLAPTPDFLKEIIEIGGVAVGVIHVEQHPRPPVIVSRDGDGLEESSILFRYPGQSSKIKYGDLLDLLSRRDVETQSALLQTAQRVSEIGVDNAYIVDAKAGTLNAGEAQVVIDQDLVDQLEFIKEGEFEEVEGAPTLKLVGDVKAVDGAGAVRRRVEGRALSAEDVLRAFLDGQKVRSPADYIRVSALVQRQWLPIHYFGRLGGLETEGMKEVLNGTSAVYRVSKRKANQRLEGALSAFRSASGEVAEVLDKILTGDIERLEADHRPVTICYAFQALPDGYEDVAPILELLEQFSQIERADTNLKGAVFRAASRIDELLYR